MLTDHPHLQGLVLGLAMLTATMLWAAPSALDAIHHLRHVPSTATATEQDTGKVVSAPVIDLKTTTAPPR